MDYSMKYYIFEFDTLHTQETGTPETRKTLLQNK